MKKVLITGAAGFIGKALLTRLIAEKTYQLSIAVRSELTLQEQINQVIIGDLAESIDWSSALTGVDVVIHTAGRAHILKESTADPIAEFRKINVLATLELAKQALAAGVKRFIFISSIGVNGNSNTQAFTEQDIPNPIANYAISKLEAEKALQALTKHTTMELVIIRPPLVYGEGVKANFYSLIKWVDRGVPLPLALVKNSRSFVALDNLVDFILLCMKHPQAANQIFLVSDTERVSTPILLGAVAKAMGKKMYLLPVPVSLLKLMASLVGKKNMAVQLCDSLEVDISKANTLLGWQPPISFEQAIEQTVASYMQNKNHSLK